jgi:hypothetical protein
MRRSSFSSSAPSLLASVPETWVGLGTERFAAPTLADAIAHLFEVDTWRHSVVIGLTSLVS